MNLSLLYMRNGQLVASLNALNTVLSLHRNSFIFSTFGLVLQLLGQNENAAKAYSKAKKLEAKAPATRGQCIIGLYNKALFYARMNKEKCISVSDEKWWHIIYSYNVKFYLIN